LQQQDPFEPAKTGDMIGQVSQIRSIELSSQLTSVLEQLNRQQRTLGASELLGKLVEAQVVQLDGSRIQVAGLVTAVRFGTDGVAVLELDSGQAVRAADVTRVTAADAQASGKSAAGAA
jgi:flagellar hook assembly protein FlgD